MTKIGTEELLKSLSKHWDFHPLKHNGKMFTGFGKPETAKLNSIIARLRAADELVHEVKMNARCPEPIRAAARLYEER